MTNFQPIKNNELSTFNSFTLEDTENENKESITLIEEATINSEDEKEEILDEEELRKKYRQVQIYNGSLEGISNKEMIESNGNFINGICENFISAMIKLSDIFQKNLSISA